MAAGPALHRARAGGLPAISSTDAYYDAGSLSVAGAAVSVFFAAIQLRLMIEEGLPYSASCDAACALLVMLVSSGLLGAALATISLVSKPSDGLRWTDATPGVIKSWIVFLWIAVILQLLRGLSGLVELRIFFLRRPAKQSSRDRAPNNDVENNASISLNEIRSEIPPYERQAR